MKLPHKVLKESLLPTLLQKVQERFTGQVHVQFNFNQGGVTNVTLRVGKQAPLDKCVTTSVGSGL